MIRQFLSLTFFLTSLIILAGCVVTYGDYTTGHFSNLEAVECEERASAMYLFFEGEEIDFEYKKIGVVESEGKEHATTGEVLNHLKYEAWENCANGLVNIKQNFKAREQGTYFSEESEEIYSSKFYSAIAVKINIDSAFIAKYGNGIDTSFVDFVREDREKKSKRTSSQVAISVVGVIVGIIVAIIREG